MTNMNDASVKSVCNAVMVGVVDAFQRSNRSIGDLDRAISIMRAEVMAMLTGEEYRSEREAVVYRSAPQQAVLASVVASCVTKIAA